MKPTTILFDFFGVFVDDIYNVWSRHSLKPGIAKQIRSDVMSKVDLNQIDRDSFLNYLVKIPAKHKRK